MQCFGPISIDLVKYFVNSKGKELRGGCGARSCFFLCIDV